MLPGLEPGKLSPSGWGAQEEEDPSFSGSRSEFHGGTQGKAGYSSLTPGWSGWGHPRSEAFGNTGLFGESGDRFGFSFQKKAQMCVLPTNSGDPDSSLPILNKWFLTFAQGPTPPPRPWRTTRSSPRRSAPEGLGCGTP